MIGRRIQFIITVSHVREIDILKRRYNVRQANNTLRVVVRSPVRLQNGHMVFRQCRPVLKQEHAISRNRAEFNAVTIGDLLCRLKKQRLISSIVSR